MGDTPPNSLCNSLWSVFHDLVVLPGFERAVEIYGEQKARLWYGGAPVLPWSGEAKFASPTAFVAQGYSQLHPNEADRAPIGPVAATSTVFVHMHDWRLEKDAQDPDLDRPRDPDDDFLEGLEIFVDRLLCSESKIVEGLVEPKSHDLKRLRIPGEWWVRQIKVDFAQGKLWAASDDEDATWQLMFSEINVRQRLESKKWEHEGRPVSGKMNKILNAAKKFFDDKEHLGQLPIRSGTELWEYIERETGTLKASAERRILDKKDPWRKLLRVEERIETLIPKKK